MRFLSCLVLGLTLALGLGCASGGEFGPALAGTARQEVISDADVLKLRESVWRLDVYTGSRYRGQGSCVVVRHEMETGSTVVLTAAHCTTLGIDTYVVISAKGEIFKGSLVKRGDYNEVNVPGIGDVEFGLDADWAVLRFPGVFGVAMSRTAVKPTLPGLDVVVIGFSHGRTDPVSRGVIQDLPEFEGDGLLFYSADTGPGSSGGAVIGLIGGKPTLLAIHTRGYRFGDGSRMEAGVPLEKIVAQVGTW
jgi:hypothetical protein